MVMQIITCKQCGEQVKPEKQTVEYVLKQQNGTEVLVMSKMTFTFNCPKCGMRTQEEPAAVD
jgi:predicted RNA-binding Zn-ribbon protein involved in translation (DUF1610 family)